MVSSGCNTFTAISQTDVSSGPFLLFTDKFMCCPILSNIIIIIINFQTYCSHNTHAVSIVFSTWSRVGFTPEYVVVQSQAVFSDLLGS